MSEGALRSFPLEFLFFEQRLSSHAWKISYRSRQSHWTFPEDFRD